MLATGVTVLIGMGTALNSMLIRFFGSAGNGNGDLVGVCGQ